MCVKTAVRQVVFFLLFWISLSLPAMAQGVGAIGGTIVDASGAVLPGVTVTLSNPGTIGGNQEAVTDARGAYQFTRLVPGSYSVKAQLGGFRPTVQENVVVNADATARVDLKLEIGQLEEGIIVKGEAPLLDTTTALNQTVMSRDLIDSLPARNDIWSIARTAPAILINKYDVGGSEAYQQANVTSHGSSGDENAYMIDGMNVSDSSGAGSVLVAYFDSTSFQEINYQTSNAPPERSQGGVVYSMITKTGTNTFQGSYTLTGASHAMGFNNISPALRTQLIAAIPARVLAVNPNIVPGADILNIFDSSVSLSGPIMRDKLWFATTAKYGKLNQYRLGSYDPNGTLVLDDNRMRDVSAKISWQATKNGQLSHYYSLSNKGQFHRTGNATTDFADSRSMYHLDMYIPINQVKWMTVLSPKMVVDTAVSFLGGHFPSPPEPEVRPGDIARYDSVLRNHTVANPNYSDRPLRRSVWLSSLSYVAGSHDVKVGYQFMRLRHELLTYSMSDFQAVYRNGVPDSVNTYNTPTHSVQFIQTQSAFIQDKWKPMRKLTVNLGLRFEYSYGRQEKTCQVATVFVQQSQCFPAINGAPDWKNLVPRLSAIYDVFGDGTTALKLSANRYDIQPGIAVVDRLNPVKPTSDTRSWTVCAAGQTSGCDLNGDGIPQLNELGPSTGFNLGTNNRYASGLKQARSNELAAEIDRQLPWDLMVSLGFYYRNTRNNIGSRNLAVPLASYIPLQVTEVTSGRQVTVYNQAPALRGKFDIVWDNLPELDSHFHGVDLTFNKRLSHRWMLMGGLSIGKNFGDIYGGASDLNNPNFTFRRGVIGSDVPVTLKASGLYQLPYGMSMSGSVQHFTGFPENTIVLVGSNTVSLTQVSQSLVVEPRGTTRLPNVNAVDVSVRKAMRIGGFKVEPVMDVFNLLNNASIQARTTQLGPTYGQAANILRGRLIKLGANVNF
jgi:carboxypeptidase family protein